jgi:nicotinamidase-related amidase
MATALICIDMQNDFILPSSPLCVAGGEAIVGNVKAALEKARAQSMHVFHVIREHDKKGVDIEWTRRYLLNGHAGNEQATTGATIAGTEGSKLIDEISIASSDRVLIKKRFSAFFATNLDLLLRRLGVKHLILCGVQTPNCIRATAVDGIGLDYRVTVLSDATASKSDAVQRSNLEDMMAMGIEIRQTAELLEPAGKVYLENASSAPPSLFQASLRAFAAII